MIPVLNATPDRNNGNVGRLSRLAILVHQVQERLRAAGSLALRDHVAREVRDVVAYLSSSLRSHDLKQIARGVDAIGGLKRRIQVVPITVVADRRHLGDPTHYASS